MHDPMTVAFDIPSYAFRKRFPFVPHIATIWHVDPEKDGSDDSCGWFMRSRHGDPAILRKIESAFDHHWDGGKLYWFDDDGNPQMATSSIVLDMFTRAAQQVYMGTWCDEHGWRGATRFCQEHLYEILRFAGNATDSFHTTIEQTFGSEGDREQRIKGAASVVYGWILRANRSWWRHPRWHVWHWRIQVPFILHLKRWLFSRCCKCGKPFKWGEAPTTANWNSTGPRWFRTEEGVYHSNCSVHEVQRSDLCQSSTKQ